MKTGKLVASAAIVAASMGVGSVAMATTIYGSRVYLEHDCEYDTYAEYSSTRAKGDTENKTICDSVSGKVKTTKNGATAWSATVTSPYVALVPWKDGTFNQYAGRALPNDSVSSAWTYLP